MFKLFEKKGVSKNPLDLKPGESMSLTPSNEYYLTAQSLSENPQFKMCEIEGKKGNYLAIYRIA